MSNIEINENKRELSSLVTQITDVHCHIMCGVDDGAKSIEQSQRMLEIAYEEGIRNVILTPHYNRRFWQTSLEQYDEGYNRICEIAARIHPDMAIYNGCEIFYNDDTMDALDEKKVPTMAGGRYVLVEFNYTIDYTRIKNAIMGMVQREYTPIIAHVERYECILRQPDRVFELVELGAYIQVNSESITGDGGIAAKKFIKKLFKWDMVHFVGTDAHGDEKRAPHIKKAYTYVVKKYGSDIARRIFVDNPRCIIDNEFLEE